MFKSNYFYAFLLSVPVLNMVVGTLFGIALLFELFKENRLGELPVALLYSVIWCLLGIVPLYGTRSIFFAMLAIVGVAAHFAFSLYFLRWLDNIFYGKMQKQVKKFQEEFDGEGKFTGLFGSATGPYISFDQQKKLFALVTEDEIFIKPFDYIKSKQLTWVETSSNGRLSYSNVKINFVTNDLNRPRMVVYLDSRNAGEDLDARLDILLQN